MTRRHARTAVRHQFIRRAPLQLGGEALPELLCREETAVAAQVFIEGRALRPGNVPGYRIDGLHVAAKTRLGAGIDEGQAGFDHLMAADLPRIKPD